MLVRNWRLGIIQDGPVAYVYVYNIYLRIQVPGKQNWMKQYTHSEDEKILFGVTIFEAYTAFRTSL